MFWYQSQGNTLQDINTFYQWAMEINAEGLVLKGLHTPWMIKDRSNAWVKVRQRMVEGGRA